MGVVPLTESFVPDLKITPREGGYARGQEGLEQILYAALNILVEQGSKALTLRRIASECGMKAGNLAYYFPSKEELLRELLNAIISSYEDAFDVIVHDPAEPAEKRLERLVVLILDDITTKKTTRVFPELWAMSNHDPFVQERVDELYQRARVAILELVEEINPALPANEREIVALFISASMEGMTTFAGYEKPWREQMPAIERIAVKSFLHIIHTLKPGEIGAMTGA
ncbi:TetR family transcriptional regulator [Sphingomonas histidinilytica]|uniref:Transcriptional regulator, TetR family n=1 Tax=Rhizorhabdus histidinilytica TaxID=439228 RepID=A0A1T5CUG8_9SPHN|nr:TetR family transcriptional regulator [Rhizorhabdus histidinilytica]QEH79045.1 TetR/AcrR family transcriptional regulator [Sphingomonas sp. C8-2]SKB63112.1 transcriptional regulator, TetR family [Rhizorhabdus histidinilytica]